MKPVKSCKTCDRRIGFSPLSFCNYSGYSCNTERMYPTKCGRDYEHGWIQRRPFWKRWLGINK